MAGNEVAIAYGRKKKTIAVIIPIEAKYTPHNVPAVLRCFGGPDKGFVKHRTEGTRQK
jgi:hypothetical protein